MPKYIVDCCLKQEILSLVLPLLKACDCGDHRQATNVFEEILRKTVQNKLERLSDENLADRIYSSYDFVMEGQGSVSLSATPTKAQESFIKSLIKVILHGVSNDSDYQVVEYQGNLLISLCIDKLYIEKSPLKGSLLSSHDEVFNAVIAILDQSTKINEDNSYYKGRKKFEINFYNIPNKTDLIVSSQISEEFDKIDLRDSADGSEKTLISTDPAYSSLPFSQDTFNLTQVHFLPSAECENIWESLYFDDNIKEKLFNYATIAIKLSQHMLNASTNVSINTAMDSNRLILIHGPPGTGKTTVCKALCHKLAIRQNAGIFSNKVTAAPAILIELSCSKVFSRWFGESSKNLDTLFKDIESLLQVTCANDQFVCLLIDEVETIAFSRSSLINKNETTDAIRVVNTLLTRLDGLKKYKNFITLATSNLIDSMDSAFIDRADGIFHIPTPSAAGCKSIIESSINQFTRMEIIQAASPDILNDQLIQASLNQIVLRCAVSTKA
ncbi:HDR077Cp [Eremothecium sinecaudum]|uniref:HDR077Cp n=1 Tax=Eremothecium sinecaudum TaxID=45286 RepID=A0A0X8HST2_9SACH|nr:HDR077Cp [Eremothecium sinecaudum]AMD20819.1 HDR077Cp [Eremothecium sinecaudum]